MTTEPQPQQNIEGLMSCPPELWDKVKVINELIATLTVYGRHEVEPVGRSAYRLMWSNASSQWYMDQYTNYASDKMVYSFDANELLVSGIGKKWINLALPWLNPLPLYAASFEAKTRGIYNPIVHIHGIAHRRIDKENC